MSPDSPSARGPQDDGAVEAPPSEEDGGTRVRGAVEGPEDRGGPAGASPREMLASLWRSRNDRLLLTALAIVAVAVALKAYVLSASSFVEDDYLFFAAANTGGLTPEYLLDLHKGHFMPGAMFLVYLQNAFLPYHWGTAAGTMLVLQTVAILAFLRLLWELFGRRWALLIPLTVYASAPLTIPVLGWWAAALNAVPFQLAIVLALLWTVRHLRTGVTMYAWWAAGAVVFGMLFSVKALFLPPLLFAFAVAFLYPGGLARSARYAFWLDRRYWLGMAALSLGYLALYLLRQRAGDGSEGASVPVWEAASGLIRRMVVEVFPTGALGGPYVWRPITPTGGLVDPLGPVLIGAWIVFVAIVVASLLLRRRAWRAWALLAGHLVFVDVVPTVIARGHMYGEVGADPRYVADAALVFALVLALAFLPVKEERAREHVGNAGEGHDRRRGTGRVRVGRVAGAAALVVTLVYAGSAAYSTHAYAQTLNGERLRTYLANARASLAEVPDDAGLYSRAVPTDVVLEWNGQRRLSSYVLAPLADDAVAERMYAPEPATEAYVFDDEGLLVEAAPTSRVNAFVPAEDSDCMDGWDGLMSWSVWEFGGIDQVATIGYTSEEDSEVGVLVGDEEVRADLPAAPDSGYVYVPIEARDTTFALFTDAETTCVTWASLGPLSPAADLEDEEDAPREGVEGDGSGEAEGSDGKN
ncbi:hypothetical protein ABZY32_08885 [Nocardiopsis alba]|uniref:hypothetical protein n=1 Tax=Nocardiopsis alba TaxID=53437 RepID=UPI0033B981CF